MRVPTTPAHLFFLRKKTPASHRARVGTSTVSLARGANREVKERVKGVCVCVFSSHLFWTSSSLDVPAGVTQVLSSTFLLRCMS